MTWSQKTAACVAALASASAVLFAAPGAPVAAGQPAVASVVAAELPADVPPGVGHPSRPPSTGSGYAPQPSPPLGAASTGAERIIGADGRSRVTATTTFPNSAIGQLRFTEDGVDYVCTGFLIDRNTILTKGYCGFTPDGGAGDIIDAGTFAPGTNGGTDPFGTCSVATVWAPPQWTGPGNYTHGFAVMNLGAECATIGDTTGWFGTAVASAVNGLDGEQARLQGYETDGTQWQMTGRIARGQRNVLFFKMDAAVGQDGSPVILSRRIPRCPPGTCAVAVYSEHFLPAQGLYATHNSGPRFTQSRIGQIFAIADQNGG